MDEFVKWTDEHRIGNLRIDTQRQHLFHLGTQALRMLESDIVDIQQTHEVLNDIVEAMRQCFIDEEKLLIKNDCPYRTQHIKEHNMLTEKLMGILMTGRGNELDRKSIHAVIDEWANQHMPKLDLQCKNCGFTIYHTPTKTEIQCPHRAPNQGR